jgi:hypothetical protein
MDTTWRVQEMGKGDCRGGRGGEDVSADHGSWAGVVGVVVSAVCANAGPWQWQWPGRCQDSWGSMIIHCMSISPRDMEMESSHHIVDILVLSAQQTTWNSGQKDDVRHRNLDCAPAPVKSTNDASCRRRVLASNAGPPDAHVSPISTGDDVFRTTVTTANLQLAPAYACFHGVYRNCLCCSKAVFFIRSFVTSPGT